MIGSFIDRWDYTWPDIWEPLGNEPDAPEDMYIELYRTAIEYFKRKPTYNEQVMIGSDPEEALLAFQQIQGKKFKSEISIIAFLEAVHDTITDEIGNDKLAIFYCELVKLFIARYNLRYRILEPFNLRVQMPWLYADLYQDLIQVNQADSHLYSLMEDFESAFDIFTRTRKKRDLRTSIAKASNYAEGVAASMIGSSGGTLGRLCDQLSIWPHDAMKEAMKNIYKFCSDYPGIRHAGNPSNSLRKLEVKDTIIVSALLIAFSGYIHSQINMKKSLS